MVWLHGGAYMYGSSREPLFDGARLAANAGVIVVTVNYRLGALGFLDLSGAPGAHGVSPNPGISDVMLALRWVHDNIAAFGGDPDRVTIFGESAGGGLVTTLLTVPSARGLFHRAVAQSSPVSSVYDRERAGRVAARFLDELGVTTVAEARRAPIDRIVQAAAALYTAIPTEAPGTLAFAPVVDGDLIPEHPTDVLREGRAAAVPLLIGTNRDEAAIFRYWDSPLLPITTDGVERMLEDMRRDEPDVAFPSNAQVLDVYEGIRRRSVGLGITRDIAFRMPSIWAAEGQCTVAPVWLYRFDFATPMLEVLHLGATHAMELPYVWSNFDTMPKDPTFRLGGRRRAQRVSHRMQSRWAAFAHGNPPDGPDGSSAWPAYELEHRSTLVIDAADRSVEDLDRDLRSGWGDHVLSFR
ncbi:carboxylesterase/lipase family protein [Agromyces salentinus]|uniref:Carboxylic ester hydrolase n=2 Tax=Agromyces salentinus TaxID=269421 RepID=A0ABN2MK65_9MICO